MNNLIIGCPVLRREWIIEKWFDHCRAAIKKVNIQTAFLFVGDQDADPTFEVIEKYALENSLTCWMQDVDEQRYKDKREWNQNRYHRMVEIRNILLGAVRSLQPTYFLSLDSDILMHEDALVVLLDSINHFDAVGGKCYMVESPQRRVPSYAMLKSNGALRRQESDGVIEVHAIMAMKMMKRQAYEIDYVWQIHGEDIGWSIAARKAALKLGWDGRVTNKHVMSREALDKVDPRCGF